VNFSIGFEFIVYPNIVDSAFSLIAHQEVGVLDDGSPDYRLVYDMSIEFNNHSYWKWMTITGIPMLIFWVFGLLAGVSWRLYVNRKCLTQPTEDIPSGVLEKYHFLTKGYEPRYYYWEIIVMLRKVGMVFISVYIKEFRIQSMLAVLLCVVALAIHALCQPFVSTQVDLLEWLSLFGSFCTYFFGQFLFEDVPISPAQKNNHQLHHCSCIRDCNVHNFLLSDAIDLEGYH